MYSVIMYYVNAILITVVIDCGIFLLLKYISYMNIRVILEIVCVQIKVSEYKGLFLKFSAFLIVYFLFYAHVLKKVFKYFANLWLNSI